MGMGGVSTFLMDFAYIQQQEAAYIKQIAIPVEKRREGGRNTCLLVWSGLAWAGPGPA